MRISGYGNLLANMSLSNPRLTRRIFSQIMNNRATSSTNNVKKVLSSYDEKLSSALKNSSKTVSDEKIDAAVKKAEETLSKQNFPQSLTNYLNYNSFYTGKSSLQTNYYSTIGGLFNYLL